MHIALATGPCSQTIVSTDEMRWIYCTGNRIIFLYDRGLRPESMYFLSPKDALNTYHWMYGQCWQERATGQKRLLFPKAGATPLA